MSSFAKSNKAWREEAQLMRADANQLAQALCKAVPFLEAHYNVTKNAPTSWMKRDAEAALAEHDKHLLGMTLGVKVPQAGIGPLACRPLGASRAGSTEQPSPFDEREMSTLLAALRYWQNHRPSNPELHDIATNGGEVEPLDEWEIDTLCERING